MTSLDSSMLYILSSFLFHCADEDLKRFLPYMGMLPILVSRMELFEQSFFPATQGG